MEKRQRFTAEFKREAVKLLNSGGKPAAKLKGTEVGSSPPIFVPAPQQLTHGNGGPRPTLRGFSCDEIHAGDAELFWNHLGEAGIHLHRRKLL